MKTEINIQPTDNELIIREGKAVDLREPQKIIIAGDIRTVSSYIAKRTDDNYVMDRQGINPGTAIVIADKKEMSIKLLLNPEDYYSPEISGKLEVSDELKAFSINQNKTFTREELVKLIRFNKLWFNDPDKHAALLLSYQSFSANANTDLKNESDTRGNKANSFIKKVDTNVPTEFILNIPVFKGYDKQTFRVEICLDVTDGGSRFWFESVELHELITKQIDEIFLAELDAAKDFVIVYK